MSSDAVSTNFETRGALEGDALEGDPLDAGPFDEPFDGIAETLRVALFFCAITRCYMRDKVLIVFVTRECYILIKHYIRNLESVVVEKSE